MTATQILEQNYIDEAVKRSAKELHDEIDFSILADLYKKNGWTEVDFNPYRRHEAIKEWLKNNCKGHRISRGRRFLFQDQSDAINFVLRWSE
jgi:hypothetical protein